PFAPLPILSVACAIALLLALALREVGEGPEEPASTCATVLLGAGLAAGLALARRDALWAFLAALGANLAVSLFVEHSWRGAEVTAFWAALVQANALVSALVALLWLAGRWRLGLEG